MKYTQDQQGYYSPTHPEMLPGENKKGQPINGPKEWKYPILVSDLAGDVYVQTTEDVTKDKAVVPVREYLAP